MHKNLLKEATDEQIKEFVNNTLTMLKETNYDLYEELELHLYKELHGCHFTDWLVEKATSNMINEDGSMDAVISIDYFMHLIPEEIRYNFEAARQWLIDSGIIGGKANTMSYRIPTQAPSSIHALRFVDVIHTVRDTIILPKEFTKITGSDFD
jgi:pantothenate kinase